MCKTVVTMAEQVHKVDKAAKGSAVCRIMM